MPILGLPWILGLFTKFSMVFVYLFSLLIPLQVIFPQFKDIV